MIVIADKTVSFSFFYFELHVENLSRKMIASHWISDGVLQCRDRDRNLCFSLNHQNSRNEHHLSAELFRSFFLFSVVLVKFINSLLL